MFRQKVRKSLEERFWEKVRKTETCWWWTANATKDKEGNRRYGLIGEGRRGERMLYAHRVSWGIHNGPIPDGIMVLHRCDNPSCVRPDHLFLGTQSDNMQDMVAKGRNGLTGPRPGTGAKSTLSRRQLLTIRRKGASGISCKVIAADFGVSAGTIRNILLGLTNQNR